MAELLNTLSNSALAALLQQGSVGVLPTDTVYGLVCRATDETAVKRLYQLKLRENKPGTVIAASIDQLVELGVKARYLKAVEQFWPNAISIVIPAADPGLAYIHKGKMSLACRIVKEPAELLNLLSVTGPLLTTSANVPGETPADTITQAQQYFGERVDFYVDGGEVTDDTPSKLFRFGQQGMERLR